MTLITKKSTGAELSRVGAFDVQTGCVLHVLDHSWPVLSGYAVRSRGLISAQSRTGQKIAVVTGPLHQLEDASGTDREVDGVPYCRTTVKGKLARMALERRWPVLREWCVVHLLRRRIVELIDRHSVQIVYAHSPSLCGLAALQAARRRRIPFVYEIRAFWEDAAVDQQRTQTRSLRYRLARGLETYVVKNADAVSGIATSILAELELRGVPREKLFHVPNGVDATRFTPIARDNQLASELELAEVPVLGFFGSLYRYEGVTWLIRAASELRARGNNFVLLIIGRGEERERLRTAIRDYHMETNVRLIDHVPHDQIERYYSVVDVMVFPRLSARITELVTPLKPLEAMALEKPVLASRVGGLSELVEHELTGLLFGPEDIPDFCQQAERLLNSPQLRMQLGKNGRENILREKDWSVLARRYRNIYNYVLKVSGSTSGSIVPVASQS